MEILALSVPHPWAWLIVHGDKDVENRSWRTDFRGTLLIHTGARVDRAGYETLRKEKCKLPALDVLESQCGCIIGRADLVDCRQSFRVASSWSRGEGWSFVLRNRSALNPTPCHGYPHTFPVPPKIVVELITHGGLDLSTFVGKRDIERVSGRAGDAWRDPEHRRKIAPPQRPVGSTR